MTKITRRLETVSVMIKMVSTAVKAMSAGFDMTEDCPAIT